MILQPTPTTCFMACVSSLTRIPIHEFPNCFDAENWDIKACARWLDTRGFTMIDLELKNRVHVETGVKLLIIATGKSPRSDRLHSVIAEWNGEDKFTYIHDPWPSGTYILEPIRFLTFILRRL